SDATLAAANFPDGADQVRSSAPVTSEAIRRLGCGPLTATATSLPSGDRATPAGLSLTGIPTEPIWSGFCAPGSGLMVSTYQSVTTPGPGTRVPWTSHVRLSADPPYTASRRTPGGDGTVAYCLPVRVFPTTRYGRSAC